MKFSRPVVSLRVASAITALALIAPLTTACEDEDSSSLTEPGLSETHASSPEEASDEKADEQPAEKPAQPPQLAPGEQALEGKLIIAGYRNMTPPDLYEEIKFADEGYGYFVIKFDGPKDVDAVMGGTDITKSAGWALLGKVGETEDFPWIDHVGKRVRIIATRDELGFATDPGNPPDAVLVGDYIGEPEILD